MQIGPLIYKTPLVYIVLQFKFQHSQMGKHQFSGIEVEQTGRIPNVQIHVELVIGNIRKKYAILKSTQPINFVLSKNGNLTTFDKIVTSCCAPVNLWDSCEF